MGDKLQVINDFADFSDNNDKILFINGTFGVGKSFFLENFKNEFVSSVNDVILYDYNHNKQTDYLHEFVYNLAMSCFAPSTIDPKETYINRKEFLEILNESVSSNKELYLNIKESNKLKNVPNFLVTKNNSDKKEIKEKFNLQNGDFHLLFSPFEISAESFIIDLLQKHYPISDNPQSKPASKKKLLFVFDNCDVAAGSINNWLFNHFINVFENIKLADFSFFDTNHYPKDACAANFFDLKIIISGREPLLPNSNYKFSTLKVEPLGREDIIAAFLSKNIEIKDNIDLIEKITMGLPYLIGLVIEAVIFGEGEIQDFNKIEQLAAIRSMNYLSPKEQDYLRAAAFLNDFDAEALEFMPLIKKDANFAFSFFEHCSEFIAKTQDGRLTVKSNMRTLIRDIVQSESLKAAKSFEIIAELYREYYNIMKNFPAEERIFIRMLAYFNCFDKIFAIQDVFEDNAATVRKIIEKYPVVFREESNYFKIDERIASAIVSLEKVSQTELYETTTEKIKTSWTSYLAELKKELNAIDKELANLIHNTELLEKQDSTLFQEHKKIEAELSVTEIKYNDALDTYQKYKRDSNIALIVVPFVIMLVSIVEIFAKFTKFDLIVLLVFAFIGAGIGLNRLMTYLKLIRDKGNLRKVCDNCKTLENAKINLSQSINKIFTERDNLARQLAAAKQLKDKLTNDVQNIKNKIKESFVREEVGN